MDSNRDHEAVGSGESPPATPAWLWGAYALLTVWGLGYLFFFFTGVIGPR